MNYVDLSITSDLEKILRDNLKKEGDIAVLKIGSLYLWLENISWNKDKFLDIKKKQDTYFDDIMTKNLSFLQNIAKTNNKTYLTDKELTNEADFDLLFIYKLAEKVVQKRSLIYHLSTTYYWPKIYCLYLWEEEGHRVLVWDWSIIKAVIWLLLDLRKYSQFPDWRYVWKREKETNQKFEKFDSIILEWNLDNWTDLRKTYELLQDKLVNTEEIIRLNTNDIIKNIDTEYAKILKSIDPSTIKESISKNTTKKSFFSKVKWFFKKDKEAEKLEIQKKNLSTWLRRHHVQNKYDKLLNIFKSTFLSLETEMSVYDSWVYKSDQFKEVIEKNREKLLENSNGYDSQLESIIKNLSSTHLIQKQVRLHIDNMKKRWENVLSQLNDLISKL